MDERSSRGSAACAVAWDCESRAASSRGRQHRLYLTPLPQGHGSLRPGRCAMAQGYYGREQAKAPLRQLSSTLSPFDRTAARLGTLMPREELASIRQNLVGSWSMVRGSWSVLRAWFWVRASGRRPTPSRYRQVDCGIVGLSCSGAPPNASGVLEPRVFRDRRACRCRAQRESVWARCRRAVGTPGARGSAQPRQGGRSGSIRRMRRCPIPQRTPSTRSR